MKNNNPSILFLSHGGGPLLLLGEESHSEMVKDLKLIAEKIDKPSAIILISAHWEEEILTITSASNPSLIYDYYGFPEESYRIENMLLRESEHEEERLAKLESHPDTPEEAKIEEKGKSPEKPPPATPA